MRALQAIGVLSLAPLLHCSVCKNVPKFFIQDVRPTCAASQLQSARFRSLRAGSSRLTFPAAASFSGKGRQFQRHRDTVSHKADDEFTGRPRSGQDSFFMSRIGESSDLAFGVADGVGGWADSGVDPAHFSHGLCAQMIRRAQAFDTSQTMDSEIVPEQSSLDPRNLLSDAYGDIVRSGEIEAGGSTACVAIAQGDGMLTVANLGDSGFMHVREQRVQFLSAPQTHAFNTPFQLSILPPEMQAMAEKYGGGPLHDMPTDAAMSTHQVQHGDVLLLATDGVWDNLDRDEILLAINQETQAHQSKTDANDSMQAAIAARIVQDAKTASIDKTRDGPFAKEVQRAYPQDNWHGGKIDDICVVVAVVTA